ncbi:MAG TPA: hypothetical protein VNG31_00630 [Candidatus Baltobacteraceae bacterium]|nr:hypothetical protein [Candidatus Baltobacteraceae bacterium]
MRIIACAVALALGGAAPSTSDPTALARAAVQNLVAQRQGVVAFHLHYAYDERGPAHHKSLIVDSIRLRVDGRLAAVRLLRQVTDGNVASRSELARQQAELDRKPPSEDFHLPLTAAGFTEYRFASIPDPCSECPAGSVRVGFTSLVRDDEHGDGSLIVDPSAHRILRIDFQPSALPKHADSGHVTMIFGPALPDLWDVVETREHYSGHVLFMHGHADVVETSSDYRRFKNVVEGLEAIKSF